jgi:hypothetical protein
MRSVQEFIADIADWIGDAHERASNPPSERAMDLFNNKIGRDLALNLENGDDFSVKPILRAIKDGHLQLSPFTIAPPARDEDEED